MNFFFSNEARADTRNISFKNSLRWSIYIINSVYEIQLSCYDPPPLDATQQFPSGWTFILFSEVNMTFGLSNSVIRCFGELVLIYTFIITNRSLSTTLKGGGGRERVVKDSCHVIIKFDYSPKGSLVIQWSPSLIGSQFSTVPLPLYSGSDDDWLPFHPPWKSCNTLKSSDPSPLESNNDWFLSLKLDLKAGRNKSCFSV